MGWLFMHDMATKQDLVRHLLRPAEWGDTMKVTDHAVTGSRLWAVIEHAEKGPFIALFLMEKSAHGWGYKDMDETMGPCYYDCPLRLLRAVEHQPPVGYAGEWREKVRRYHAVRRPVAGTVVAYDGRQYRLESSAGPRMGWIVVDVATGTNYRMKAGQVRQALRAQV